MHLPGLLAAYGNEIEADFQQYYRLDVLGMFRGEITPARVLRLILALPAESRFIRAAAGSRADWTPAEHLLAGILDTLSAANWQRGGGKGPKPKPIPRPGNERQTKRYGKTKRSPAEVLAFLEQLNNGQLKKAAEDGDKR